MSKHHKLTVLYGASGDHLGDVEELESYIKEYPLPNVSFVAVKPSSKVVFLNSLNKKGIFPYSFYIAYREWHKLVFREAQELIKTNTYDLIHYLNPIGYREPGYLWELNLPYMWGPINGMCNYPSIMLDFQPISFRAKYMFRSLINKLQLNCSIRVRKAIMRANKVLVATTENAEICKKVFHIEPTYLPENCLTASATLDETKFSNIDNKIRLIAVGSLDGRKNFLTILKALHYMQSQNHYHLDIIGDGPMRTQLETYAQDSGISDAVTFHGLLSREKVMSIFKNAHLHIITSIGEGNPTTIWEAMSYGVPTITVDHCGMHDTVSEDDGYKVPISTSENISNDIARILDEIASNPNQLITKAKAVIGRSKVYQWDDRIEYFEHCYDECIANFYKSQL